MKKLILYFVLLFPLVSYSDEDPQKILVVRTKQMTEGKVSNVHVFSIKVDLQNVSSKNGLREILLDVALLNKANETVASKLAAVRWDKMKPFVKRSFWGKIKNTLEKTATEETPRKKMENMNVLKPSETKEFEILFFDEDFKSSETEDKVPTSYNIKFHSAKIVPKS